MSDSIFSVSQHFTGSEYVEKAPLEVCAKLVIESRRERREKERKEKEQKLTDDLAEMKAKREEEAAEKKKVVIVTPEEAKQAGSRKQWWPISHLIRWDFIQKTLILDSVLLFGSVCCRVLQILHGLLDLVDVRKYKHDLLLTTYTSVLETVVLQC